MPKSNLLQDPFFVLRGRGITRSEIAKRCGVTHQAVCSWFKAKRFPASRAVQIAEIAGMPVETVLRNATAQRRK